MDGYANDNGLIKVFIFRNKSLRYLEIWNDFDDNIVTQFYAF